MKQPTLQAILPLVILLLVVTAGWLPSVPSPAGAADTPATEPAAVKDSPDAEPPSHRTLAVYYSRREFYGGPPVIPHEVDPADSNTNCLDCHEEGGYYDEYQAWIPPTPHPGFRNCNACHVVDTSARDTSEAMLARIAPPALAPDGSKKAMRMPHTLQLRENCLACHGTAAAPAEIRTPHPQRKKCQMCHKPLEGSGSGKK